MFSKKHVILVGYMSMTRAFPTKILLPVLSGSPFIAGGPGNFAVLFWHRGTGDGGLTKPMLTGSGEEEQLQSQHKMG